MPDSKINKIKDKDLMEFLKYVPKETTETAIDFVRATMMMGQDQHLFDTVWKYIAMVNFRNTLNPSNSMGLK